MSEGYHQFTVKGQLADLNKHDGANRSNKFVGAKLKKDMTDIVAWQVKSKPPVENPCIITFHWYYSSKHDFDNIRFSCKYILDGMVKAGVLKNDNQKWVLGFGGDNFIKVNKGQEKVIIEAEEIA